MSAADRMVVRTRDGSYRSVPRRVGLGMISRGHATPAKGGTAAGGYPEPGYTIPSPAEPAPLETIEVEITTDSDTARMLGLEDIAAVEQPEPIVIGGTPEQVEAIMDALAPVLEPVGPDEVLPDGEIPTVYAVELPQEPKQTALRSVWVDYARSLGVEVTSEMTKNQIRDAAQDAAQSLANLPQPALPGGRLETPEDEPATEESVADANEDPGTR